MEKQTKSNEKELTELSHVSANTQNWFRGFSVVEFEFRWINGILNRKPKESIRRIFVSNFLCLKIFLSLSLTWLVAFITYRMLYQIMFSPFDHFVAKSMIYVGQHWVSERPASKLTKSIDHTEKFWSAQLHSPFRLAGESIHWSFAGDGNVNQCSGQWSPEMHSHTLGIQYNNNIRVVGVWNMAVRTPYTGK